MMKTYFESGAAGGKGTKNGWSKGSRGSGSWTKPKTMDNAVPADFALDTTARYTGTVTTYGKMKGFGFIKLAKEGIVPGNTAFVFWSDIVSNDRYPMLLQGQEV